MDLQHKNHISLKGINNPDKFLHIYKILITSIYVREKIHKKLSVIIIIFVKTWIFNISTGNSQLVSCFRLLGKTHLRKNIKFQFLRRANKVKISN